MLRFSIKPVFIVWATLVVQLPIQLFATLWAGLALGSFLEDRLPGDAGFLIPGIVFFFGIPVLVLISKKLNYDRTEYRFFEDRLEFEEGFFTIQKKTIKYRDVKEVTLRRGILQRANGLGTVYLATLATGTAATANPFASFGGALGFNHASNSGIMVRDIADPENQYEKIRSVIEPHN